VLDLKYFADGIGTLDHLGVGVAAGEDEMQARRFLAQDIQHLLQIHQLQFQGVVDLIENDEVIQTGSDFLMDQVQGILGVGPAWKTR